MKNEIIVALDEKLEVKLDQKLDKTLSKINEKVTKNETAIVELQDKQKDNIEKVDDLTARMNVDNEILVDNTESLDKIDKDNKLMELRVTETETQVTELVSGSLTNPRIAKLENEVQMLKDIFDRKEIENSQEKETRKDDVIIEDPPKK